MFLLDKIGVNRQQFHIFCQVEISPSVDFFAKMATSFPDLNLNWIVSGVGFMNKSEERKRVEKTKNIKKIVVFYDDNSFEELNT